MSSDHPGRPDLEFEKKQAKALLKGLRSGDADAVARMRAHLPRVADSGAADVTLADAQFMLARARGFESWPRMKSQIESQRTLQEQIVLFMRAATAGKLAVAKRILAQRPEMTEKRLQVACAAADVTNVNALLARDPTLATQLG